MQCCSPTYPGEEREGATRSDYTDLFVLVSRLQLERFAVGRRSRRRCVVACPAQAVRHGLRWPRLCSAPSRQPDPAGSSALQPGQVHVKVKQLQSVSYEFTLTVRRTAWVR